MQPDSDTNNQEPSAEEISEALGFRIGAMIALLPISDEKKESLMNLVEHANTEQLLNTYELLEQMIEDAATQETDKEIQQSIRQGIKKITTAQDALANITVESMAQLIRNNP